MKIITSVVSALLIAATLSLFSFNSRLITVEAKVPHIEKTHDKAQDLIFDKLTYIEKKVDNIVLLLTKHK